MQDEHVFPVTFSRPTGRQPKQRLELHFHKIQCPSHFFKGSKYHPHQRRIPCESGPPGTASTSFAYMELTCPPCVRLWGPWKTMFHVMSHKKRALFRHIIFVFLMSLARQL